MPGAEWRGERKERKAEVTRGQITPERLQYTCYNKFWRILSLKGCNLTYTLAFAMPRMDCKSERSGREKLEMPQQ